MRFNLSEWALKHRSLVVYFMIVAVAAGLLSYFRLGRERGPCLHHQDDGCPGRLARGHDRRHAEAGHRTARADAAGNAASSTFLRSFTSAGVTTIFVNLKGSATAQRGAGHLAPRARNRRRHAAHATGWRGRPGFNDKFGDTFGIIYGFTADGFSGRELRDYVEDVRSKLLHVQDVSKIEVLGAQDERIFVEFSMKELADLGIDRSALISALQAQNIVQPGGTIQTGDEKLSFESPAPSGRSRTSRTSTLPLAGACSASATSRRFAEASPIRRSRCSASTASRRSALRSRCATAATFSRSADNIKRAMAAATADLPHRHRADARRGSGCHGRKRHRRSS